VGGCSVGWVGGWWGGLGCVGVGGGGGITIPGGSGGNGAGGFVRIIWGDPTNLRNFENTRTTDSAAGTYQIEIPGKDNIPTTGPINMALFSGETFIDMTPEMTITSGDVINGGSTSNSSITVTFTSTEPTSNFENSDITINKGTLSTLIASNQHSSGGYYEYSSIYTLSTNPPNTHTITVPHSVYTNSKTTIGSLNLAVPNFTFSWTQGISFPVNNPEIQWIVGGNEAEKSSVSSVTSTASTIDPELYWTGINITGTKEWRSSIVCTRTLYVNKDGDNVYYLIVPAAADLTTNALTNNGTDVSANGFTWWYVTVMPTSTSSWWRPWTYRGVSLGDTNVSISPANTLINPGSGTNSGNQYTGPLIFMNSGWSDGGRFEYRKPKSSPGYASTAYPPSGTTVKTFEYSTGGNVYISIFILNQNPATGTGAGNTTFSSRIRSSDGVNGNWNKPSSTKDYDNESLSTGTSNFGLNTTNDMGKPWFNDSTYWSNSTGNPTEIVNLIHSGFANKAYSPSEMTSLMSKLIELYMGSNV